jgi:hypothetical protein
MKLLKILGMGIFLMGTLFLFACDGGGGDGGSGSAGTGTLSLGMADSATDKYQAVYITVDEVHVKSNSASVNDNKGWQLVARPKKTYNLLNLVNGVTAVLGEAELLAGHYNQIRLKLGKTPESKNNIFGEPHPYACYVIFNDGDEKTATILPLKVPSGYQSGYKLVHQFEVLEGQVVELELDFDACRSVVQASNGDKCILKPTIKVINILGKSIVMGMVIDDEDPAEPLGGVSVSAQVTDQDSARVVRTTITDDGLDEEGNENEEDKGHYQLVLSPDTSFNVVAFSGAKISIAGPNPGSTIKKMYQPACKVVYVPLSGVVDNFDFQLEESDFGTISGTVRVTTNSGDVDPDDPPVVYITFYADVAGCGYVEIATEPVYPDTDGTLQYSVDLPLGNYDVVASAEGYIPNTGQAALNISFDTQSVDLNITELPGS